MSGINVGTIVRRVHAGAAMVFVLVGAIGSVLADDRAIFVTSPGQPLNVGDAMLAATAYHDSGAYAEIEQAGFTIIANMGDQPSDLLGGRAERMFLLPNPFYRVP